MKERIVMKQVGVVTAEKVNSREAQTQRWEEARMVKQFQNNVPE